MATRSRTGVAEKRPGRGWGVELVVLVRGAFFSPAPTFPTFPLARGGGENPTSPTPPGRQLQERGTKEEGPAANAAGAQGRKKTKGANASVAVAVRVGRRWLSQCPAPLVVPVPVALLSRPPSTPRVRFLRTRATRSGAPAPSSFLCLQS